jgi:hypothetical protein
VWGNGNGTFGAATAIEASRNNTTVGDFDNDGWVDIAVSTGSTASFYVNHRDRTFTKVFSITSGLIHAPAGNFADLNGDGIQDFVLGEGSPEGVAPSTGTLKVHFGVGNGTFGAPANYTMVKAPFGGGPTLGDVDGDGKIDVVTGNGDANSVSVFLNDGTGALRAKADYASGLRTFVGVPSDLNLDGTADVVVSNSHSNTFGYFLSSASGALATQVTKPSGGSDPNYPVVADLNRDGWPDVVVPNYYGQNVAVLISTCTP